MDNGLPGSFQVSPKTPLRQPSEFAPQSAQGTTVVQPIQTQPVISAPQNIPTIVQSPVGTTFQEKPAGIRLRFAASFFDGLIIGLPMEIMYFVYIFIAGMYFLAQNNLLNYLLLVIYGFFFTVYFIYFDVHKGATPGKGIYGLKVIDVTTKQNLSVKKAFKREILMRGISSIPLIGAIFNIINFFVIWSSTDKRGLHDKAGNSQVLIKGKSWSFLKQFGLFLILMFLIILPYIIFFSAFRQVSQKQSDCLSRCVNDSKTNIIKSTDSKNLIQLCVKQCPH